MLLSLSLVVFAAASFVVGLTWAGQLPARASWVVAAGSALLLAGLAIFTAPASYPGRAFAAASAAFFALCALEARARAPWSGAFGAYSLFFAFALAFATAGYSHLVGELNIFSLAALLAALAALAVAAAYQLALTGKARRPVGWGLVAASCGILVLVYLPELGTGF